MFKPWEERRAPQLQLGSILARARRELAGISEAVVVAFNPPPIRGLSVTEGFQFQVQDFGAEDLGTLQGLTQEIIRRGSQRPELVGLFSTFRANTPLLYLDIEQAAMEAGRIRLRPILMTSFAFILGVLPLAVATGAGAASRHSLGTAVLGGWWRRPF